MCSEHLHEDGRVLVLDGKVLSHDTNDDGVSRRAVARGWARHQRCILGVVPRGAPADGCPGSPRHGRNGRACKLQWRPAFVCLGSDGDEQLVVPPNTRNSDARDVCIVQQCALVCQIVLHASCWAMCHTLKACPSRLRAKVQAKDQEVRPPCHRKGGCWLKAKYRRRRVVR